MESAGADPTQGVDVPEAPAVGREAQNPPPQQPDSQGEVIDAFDGTVSDAVGDLLSNIDSDMGWRQLELPSRGKAYIESTGYVEIKPFTFAQERTLRSVKQSADADRVIKSLFAACVKGLGYPEMTLADKTYILFKLREISYGNEYTISAECQECEANNSLVLEIDKIPVAYAPDDYEEPFTITLPDSKQEVKFITPRSKDEKLLTNVSDATDNLWRFALSVGKYSDERIKKEFFQKTTVRDISFFRENLLRDRYGLNKSMAFDCAKCGALNDHVIPFSENFFSVS